jgi:hypothetical protein
MAENAGHCHLCRKELHGDLGVFEEEIGEVLIIIIRETSPRNWIQCDSCNTVVCHDCCSYPQAGYCNTCIETYHLLPTLEEIIYGKEERDDH